MIPINLTDTIIKENFEINDIPIETSSVIYNSEINNINTNIEDTWSKIKNANTNTNLNFTFLDLFSSKESFNNIDKIVLKN